MLRRVFLSNQLGDVALLVNGLSMLIGLALFEHNGFFTDDALWTPLPFGNMFGKLNDLGHFDASWERTVPTVGLRESKS